MSGLQRASGRHRHGDIVCRDAVGPDPASSLDVGGGGGIVGVEGFAEPYQSIGDLGGDVLRVDVHHPTGGVRSVADDAMLVDLVGHPRFSSRREQTGRRVRLLFAKLGE